MGTDKIEKRTKPWNIVRECMDAAFHILLQEIHIAAADHTAAIGFLDDRKCDVYISIINAADDQILCLLKIL